MVVCVLVIAGCIQSEKPVAEMVSLSDLVEVRVDGELAVKGSEMSVNLSQLKPVSKQGEYYLWALSTTNSEEGACRLGRVSASRIGRPADVFIGRPKDTMLVVSPDTFRLLDDVSSQDSEGEFLYDDTGLEFIENRGEIPVVTVGEGGVNTIKDFKSGGFVNIILGEDEKVLSASFEKELKNQGFNTMRKPIHESGSPGAWIKEATGLHGSGIISFNSEGRCVYSTFITGKALTKSEAEEERNKILL